MVNPGSPLLPLHPLLGQHPAPMQRSRMPAAPPPVMLYESTQARFIASPLREEDQENVQNCSAQFSRRRIIENTLGGAHVWSLDNPKPLSSISFHFCRGSGRRV